jgi:hypothetical protein
MFVLLKIDDKPFSSDRKMQMANKNYFSPISKRACVGTGMRANYEAKLMERDL